MSRFNNVARINAPRTKFHMPQSVKTSGSVGTLYPVFVQEIYPGDTFNVNTTFVARLSSSYIRPVMDNLYVDFYYFYVPARLCYDRWEEIFGENKNGAWAQPEPVSAPVTTVATNNVSKSVGDYLGVPVGSMPSGTNIIPFRAFAKIYDDWFRDENLIDPMFINRGSWDHDTETPNDDPWAPDNYFGMLPKVAKFHDVFTSALPNTQKSNEPVYVPLAGFVPLSVGDKFGEFESNPQFLTNATDGGGMNLWMGPGIAGNGLRTLSGYATSTVPATSYNIEGTNLGISLAEAGVLTVPDMRYAFQLQRILERASRSGSRYTEYILSAFGVQSPDSRLQRAEYLGGKRMPLSIQQVAQTTRGTNEDDELGSLGAFSLSNGKCGFTKGFVEHGFVIGVMCIRQHHTYQQGLEKFWQRRDRFDYYDPALAHISEQPIYKSELYARGQEFAKGDIFGYQEAWYDLRNRMDLCTGEMRSDAENSLDIWHFGDDYEYAPFLTQAFIEETPVYVDRAIAVPSTSLDQFIFDIYHDIYATRRLPAYSTPGLIDHY